MVAAMDKTIWQDIISSLSAAGMTYAQIAKEAGCAMSTIGDLATGRSKAPTGMTAVNLMNLRDKKQPKAA